MQSQKTHTNDKNNNIIKCKLRTLYKHKYIHTHIHTSFNQINSIEHLILCTNG